MILCGPIDCSLSGSSVHGIFQARVLEWIATSFSRGSSPPRDRTRVIRIPGRHFTSEPPGKPILDAAAKSLQSCPTLCDPRDGSPPGSPIPGTLQARTLEWVVIAFSNAWKWKVKVKSLSCVRLLVTPWTAARQAPPSMGFARQEYWSGVPSPSPHFRCRCYQIKLGSTHLCTAKSTHWHWVAVKESSIFIAGTKRIGSSSSKGLNSLKAFREGVLKAVGSRGLPAGAQECTILELVGINVSFHALSAFYF